MKGGRTAGERTNEKGEEFKKMVFLGRRILTIKGVLWRRKCGQEAATKQ